MAASYELINYALRPAKAVERKMMCEALRRLSEFGAVAKYQYVGFGSTYFSDFVLFHRQLSISDMVSIEHDVAKSERFEFNKPFACVKIEFGESGVILAKMKWKKRAIVWLDYDGKLNQAVLADVATVAGSAQPGSVLIVSVNAESRGEEHLLEGLQTAVGGKVPIDVQEKDLLKWGMARVCTRIIRNEIDETLSSMFHGEGVARRVFRQIFNFNYSDGARMLTIGGILIDEGQEPALAKCNFDDLSFVRRGDDPFLVDVPNLTYREIRYLDARLPLVGAPSGAAPGIIPEKDVARYAALYRYFPVFSETEV